MGSQGGVMGDTQSLISEWPFSGLNEQLWYSGYETCDPEVNDMKHLISKVQTFCTLVCQIYQELHNAILYPPFINRCIWLCWSFRFSTHIFFLLPTNVWLYFLPPQLPHFHYHIFPLFFIHSKILSHWQLVPRFLSKQDHDRPDKGKEESLCVARQVSSCCPWFSWVSGSDSSAALFFI